MRRKLKTATHLQCMLFEKRIVIGALSDMDLNKVITIEEVCHLWRLKYESVLDLIKSGDLKGEKRYGIWRISVPSLNAYLTQLDSEFPW